MTDESSEGSDRISREAWEIIRTLVFQRDDFTCRYCGAHNRAMHCDHIVPLALGGTNSPYNLQTLCRACNVLKGAQPPSFVIKAPAWALWHKLIAKRPALIDVYQSARAIRDDFKQPSFCANEHFYGYRDHETGLKQRLSQLVGDSQRGNSLFGTHEAYDVAYEVIYNALPNCRNCWCG